MRTIKFRAWNEKHKTMYVPDNLIQDDCLQTGYGTLYQLLSQEFAEIEK